MLKSWRVWLSFVSYVEKFTHGILYDDLKKIKWNGGLKKGSTVEFFFLFLSLFFLGSLVQEQIQQTCGNPTKHSCDSSSKI